MYRIVPVFLSFFLILFYSAISQSKMPDNLDTILKQLDIERSTCFDELVVEKPIPYAPEKSVMVIPVIAEADSAGGDYSYIFDSYIIIIDKSTNKIINRFYRAKACTSDAVALENIEIDFAPYILNSETRAFGVRTYYHNMSHIFPYDETDLSLFVLKDESILMVLKDFEVSVNRGELYDECKGKGYCEEKKLVMSEKTKNDYCNIIVKNKVTHTRYIQVNNDCFPRENTKTVTKILRFNGIEYK